MSMTTESQSVSVSRTAGPRLSGKTWKDFMMTDSWFDEYVFQVVVPRQLASPSLVRVLDMEPIVLPPWDPLGSLA